MRWMTFEANGGSESSFGFVDGDFVVDVGSQSEHESLKSAIASAALEDLYAAAQSDATTASRIALSDVRFLPPIERPDKILCVGLNYADHQAETGHSGGDHPTIFVRFAEAQVGHLGNMIRPRESTRLDYEGEIAMIIGRHASRVPKDDWLDYVAGFSCYNDGSVRDWQRHTSQFTPGKNFRGTGGSGPWMMTPDEVGDLEAMEITTRLNGNVMQNALSSQLIFGFAALIEYCTTFTDLRPGDLIVTGTPGGVGSARRPPVWMDEGDVIEIEVAPIGTLRNTVVVG